MTESQIQASVLDRYGLRIRNSHGAIRHWANSTSPEVALIGVDARTGVPRRVIVARDAVIQTIRHQ